MYSYPHLNHKLIFTGSPNNPYLSLKYIFLVILSVDLSHRKPQNSSH